MTEEPNKSPFVAFWSTLPGIFTGIAAVITAVASLYIATRNTTPDAPPDNTTTSMDTTSTSMDTTSTSAPSDIIPGPTPTSLSGDSPELREVDWATSAFQSAVEACTLGDENACVFVFDTLANECSEGVLDGCDLLYEWSPPDSEYEYYGATCGYRVEHIDYAGECILNL